MLNLTLEENRDLRRSVKRLCDSVKSLSKTHFHTCGFSLDDVTNAIKSVRGELIDKTPEMHLRMCLDVLEMLEIELGLRGDGLPP